MKNIILFIVVMTGLAVFAQKSVTANDTLQKLNFIIRQDWNTPKLDFKLKRATVEKNLSVYNPSTGLDINYTYHPKTYTFRSFSYNSNLIPTDFDRFSPTSGVENIGTVVVVGLMNTIFGY